MFDDDKNQSVMLSSKANQMRNQIMIDFKYEQMKRSKLRERMRQAKKDILAERAGNLDTTDGQKDSGKTVEEKLRQTSHREGLEVTAIDRGLG